MVKKIAIYGWFGERNTGDDFLLNETLNCINTNFTNTEITVYTNHAEELQLNNSAPNINYIKKNQKNILLGMIKNDYFIFGPGGLLPNRNIGKIVGLFLSICILKILGKKTIFFGLGVENCNYFNPISRFLIFSIFKMSESCTLRYDYKIYKTQRHMPKKCIPAVDLMFSKTFTKHKTKSRQKFVSIALANIFNSEVFKQSFQNELIPLIKQIIDDGYYIKFLTFTDKKDNQLNQEIYEKLDTKYQKKCKLIKYLEDLDAVLDIINNSDFVIAMRYHALVFSIAYAKPFISLSYSSKHDELIHEINSPYLSVKVCEGGSQYYCQKIHLTSSKLIEKYIILQTERIKIIANIKKAQSKLKEKSNLNKLNLVQSLTKKTHFENRTFDNKKLIFHNITSILTIILFFVATYHLYKSQLLPLPIFLISVSIIMAISLFFIKLSKRYIFVNIILCLIIAIFTMSAFVFFKYNNYFSKINTIQNIEKYSLITLKDSDLAKTNTGSISRIGLLKTDPYLNSTTEYLKSYHLLQNNTSTPTISETDYLIFDNILTMFDALIEKNNASSIKTIFLNNTYINILKESHSDIYQKLHIISSVDVLVKPKEVETTKISSLDKPFILYISGIDNLDHTLPFAARSDVNLLLVINPIKYKILILNTPRDFYVPLAMNGKFDKLTHAGLYGVNESIHTLENLYSIKINYYTRINFDAVSTVIDILDGVDVYIPYAMNTYHGGKHYEPGSYKLNGIDALNFARERFSISWAGGDRERGRNQEKILTALIQKLQSDKTNLTRLDQIFNSIAKNIQTNFTPDDLKYLVQKQLTNFSNWQIESIDVDGKADITSTYTYPEPKHFVWHPYQDTVDRAKTKLQEYLAE